MTFLPDVNVWIALIAAEHPHSSVAQQFVSEQPAATLALCRVTQMSILRLLTNPHVMGLDVKKAGQAWEIWDRLLAAPNVAFANEPYGIEDKWRSMVPEEQKGPNFWTDAYLAAFAQVTGYTLVTFNRGFSKYRKIPLRILSAKVH